MTDLTPAEVEALRAAAAAHPEAALPASVKTWPKDVLALCASHEALRASHAALHRRCQSAEAGLAAALAGKDGGPSLGRTLANAAATMYRAQLDEYREAVRAALPLLLLADAPSDVVDPCHARLRALVERDTPPGNPGNPKENK